MFSLQNQVWGITFYIFFPARLFSLPKILPIPPPFLQDLYKEVLVCGCRGPITSAERVEIITIIIVIITMEKGLYPLSGVSMGGGDAPCLVEWFPLEGVQPQMLEQICWASLSPNLSLGEIISCPDLGTPLPCRASMAWAGGEWDLEEELLLLDAVEVVPCGCDSNSSPPALVFGKQNCLGDLT